MSERITWTTCPHCGEAAAVGWLQEEPIEFDCKTGCTMADLGLLLQESSPALPRRQCSSVDRAAGRTRRRRDEPSRESGRHAR